MLHEQQGSRNEALVEATGKIPPWLASFMLCFQFLGGMAMFIQLLLVIMVRYFSIFHSHVIMDLNEIKFKRKSRICICLLSLACMLFEMANANLGFGPAYKFLVGEINQEEKQTTFYTILTIMVLDIILMVILQIKVELQNHQERDQTEEKDGASRIVFVCVVLMLLSSALISLNSWLKFRFTFVLWSLIAFNVMPCIFIFRNKNITKYSMSKFALWIVNVLAPNRLHDIQ